MTRRGRSPIGCRAGGAAADADARAGVLSDPEIGGFEIRTMVDQPPHLVAEAVEEFFADRSPEDLLVLHFSGHGIKNQEGELHFAAANTKLTRLGAKAVAAQFVNRGGPGIRAGDQLLEMRHETSATRTPGTPQPPWPRTPAAGPPRPSVSAPPASR